eukprot:TRINITY_DN12213_c0_g1_i11.p1 TRINITY_DN12213_c0_g1~~TRINITY_DN12213_c0_g1_i11.p1  ORF type:complete len:205 (-),score=26.65 TRINITY_DN12213_c0_g1_i11:353-967(-)
MRYEYSYRSGRSLSPDPISLRYGYRSLSIPPTSNDYELPSFTCVKNGTFSQHVDNLLRRSRANSEIRSSEFSELPSSNPDMQYSSILCNSLTPWSKTGAFYYPSYKYSTVNTTDVGEHLEEFRQKIEAEIAFNLEIENSLGWEDGDVEVSMEKEYEYPESWRGTSASTPALRREYYYWTNPARYYRHRTYYPRYLPRYRSRYYR